MNKIIADVRSYVDARLELGRVGIKPNPKYLATEKGKEIARHLH